MNKHTPGPWKFGLVEGDEVNGRPTQYYMIYRPHGNSFGDPICSLNERLVMDDSTLGDEANARLIAAAPRMYELLAEARELFRDGGMYNRNEGVVWAINIRDLIKEIDGQEVSHE